MFLHLQTIFTINCPNIPEKWEIGFFNFLERQLNQDYQEA